MFKITIRHNASRVVAGEIELPKAEYASLSTIDWEMSLKGRIEATYTGLSLYLLASTHELKQAVRDFENKYFAMTYDPSDFHRNRGGKADQLKESIALHDFDEQYIESFSSPSQPVVKVEEAIKEALLNTEGERLTMRTAPIRVYPYKSFAQRQAELEERLDSMEYTNE